MDTFNFLQQGLSWFFQLRNFYFRRIWGALLSPSIWICNNHERVFNTFEFFKNNFTERGKKFLERSESEVLMAMILFATILQDID